MEFLIKSWYPIQGVRLIKIACFIDCLRRGNMRVNITLECTECKERNYITTKNKRNDEGRIEMNKYCPRERKVTLHRETKGK